jgi:hypothetical protein
MKFIHPTPHAHAHAQDTPENKSRNTPDKVDTNPKEALSLEGGNKPTPNERQENDRKGKGTKGSKGTKEGSKNRGRNKR